MSPSLPIQAMVPPPAPRVWTASMGVARSCPAMRPAVVSSERPSRITLMSVEVPPMSKVTRFRRPRRPASSMPETTPAAGPDSRVWLG